ncbi:hypothetical protein GCM10008919_17850 [Selenomonas dianae]|uniref:Uncharacterized protein n=1 Tax=Selenomonas dianae TaxID=135079 RepID=A0ABN0T8D8_9FIRM
MKRQEGLCREGGAFPCSKPSEASGEKGTFCPLRISTVQAKRV